MAGLLTLHTVFLHLLHLSDGFSEVRCEAQSILEAGGIEDDEDFALPTRYCRQQLDPKLVICWEGEGQAPLSEARWLICEITFLMSISAWASSVGPLCSKAPRLLVVMVFPMPQDGKAG